MDEDALRRVLDTEAATIDVRPDALPVIRRRIAARRRHRLPVGLLAAAAATAAAAAFGLATVAPLVRAPDQPPVAANPELASLGPAQPAPVSAPATGPTPNDLTPTGATPTGSTPAGGGGQLGGTATLAVYYLAEDAGRIRLYREFNAFPLPKPTPTERVRATVTEMLAGQRRRDPDYRTGWPTTARLGEVGINDDGTVTLDLTGARANSVGAEAAHLAVQQLVWTVAGAIGGNPGVRLRFDGEPVAELWGHVDTRPVLRKAPALEVLGMLWLIDPQHGDTVGRTFRVHLAGAVFEATAQVRVRQGDRIVTEQVVTLNAGAPARGEATIELTLPPGAYTLEAYEESMADGSELHLDDRDIVVR